MDKWLKRRASGMGWIRGAVGTVFLAMSVCATGQSAIAKSVVVPAGTLDDALTVIGDTFNIDILVAGNLTAGKRAQAVSGDMTARDAIARVLEQSGLALEVDGDTYLIVESTKPAPNRQP